MHSLVAGIANSFTDNLIAEQRYRMILDGLQVTLLITFCAAVLGTLLGGVVCLARQLDAEQGTLVCPQLDKVIAEWLEVKRQCETRLTN